MRPYRGKTADGKRVEGWLVEIEGHHYIIDEKTGCITGQPSEHMGWYEVLPETVEQVKDISTPPKQKRFKGAVVGPVFVYTIRNEVIIQAIMTGSSFPPDLARKLAITLLQAASHIEKKSK